jgi:hypothetical protein
MLYGLIALLPTDELTGLGAPAADVPMPLLPAVVAFVMPLGVYMCCSASSPMRKGASACRNTRLTRPPYVNSFT